MPVVTEILVAATFEYFCDIFHARKEAGEVEDYHRKPWAQHRIGWGCEPNGITNGRIWTPWSEDGEKSAHGKCQAGCGVWLTLPVQDSKS